MNTKQYVKKYKLDDFQYSNHFNTDLFLQDLNEEFQARIQREKDARKKEHQEYTFRIFNVIITEIQNKFCAISNKKVGGPLRPELWNAFYAKYIIPVRIQDFPEEHKKIQAKREAYDKNLIRDKVIEEYGLEKYAQLRATSKATKNWDEFTEVRDKIEAEVNKRYGESQNKKNKGPKKVISDYTQDL